MNGVECGAVAVDTLSIPGAAWVDEGIVMRRKLFYTSERAGVFHRRINRWTRLDVMWVQYCGPGVWSVDFC